MRSSYQSSPFRGVMAIGVVLWAGTVVLVVGIAQDKARRGELITLSREIGR